MTLNDHPAVGQGRQPQHHHPQVNREVLVGLLMVFVPWAVVWLAFLVWRTFV